MQQGNKTVDALDLEHRLVLAGPMLRRCEPSRVCIWIATTKAVVIKAEIVLVKQDSLGKWKKDKIIGDNQHIVQPKTKGADQIEGKTDTVKLGQYLFVHVVQVVPKIKMPESECPGGYFPPDKLLGYQLYIGIENKEIEITSLAKNITYPDFELPVFYLRGPGNPLSILHGSCRKLHYEGDDALAGADTWIAKQFESISNSKRRGLLCPLPCAMFLTGDQIYADEVASPLIKHLTALGNKLLGYSEALPDVGDISKLDVDARTKWARKSDDHPKSAQFTSTEDENHLFGFGEYAAMHLVAWNVENWPGLFPPLNSVDIDIRHIDEGKYQKQIDVLEKLRKAMPRVRRLLANLPVYMLLDDHEITDDFMMHNNWVKSVQNSMLGRRIVANGLAAYLIFQAWGNDPDAFASNQPGEGLLLSAIQYLDKKTTLGKDRDGWLDFERKFWNFKGWTFCAPTFPPAIFLDGRMNRDYNIGPPVGLTTDMGIVDAKLQWDSQIKNITNTYGSSQIPKTLLIVLPSPLLGIGGLITRDFITNSSELYPEALIEKLDTESWMDSDAGFINFLTWMHNQFRPFLKWIVFSGDVHLAYTAAGYFEERLKGSSTLLITQLTSSGQKNVNDFKWVLQNTLHPENPYIRFYDQNSPYINEDYTLIIDFRQNRLNEKERLKFGTNIGLVQFARPDLTKGDHRLINGSGEVIYRASIDFSNIKVPL